MSFDIYFIAVDEGDVGELPLAFIENAFQKGSAEWVDSTLRIEYSTPDGLRTIETVDIDFNIVLGDDEPKIAGFSVNRPPECKDFWLAIVSFLQISHSALFWPGNHALAVGMSETIAHLPPEMIASLGEPNLISTPEQLLTLIRTS